MAPGSFLLPGAAELKPLSQGSLSKLCGLYSLLNGVLLALHPVQLSKSERQALYVHAVAHLSRHRQLKRVLGEGMYEDVWMDLGSSMLSYVNAAFYSALTFRRSFPAPPAVRSRAIERIKSDVRRGNPVLLHLGRTLNHYSVVCGYTPTRLKLFDSSGLSYLRLENVGLEWSAMHHWIRSETTFALFDDW